MKPIASKQRRRGMGRGYEGKRAGWGEGGKGRGWRVVYVKYKLYRQETLCIKMLNFAPGLH
jgi:hypothetical protein